jgi:hypothetical protein
MHLRQTRLVNYERPGLSPTKIVVRVSSYLDVSSATITTLNLFWAFLHVLVTRYGHEIWSTTAMFELNDI